MPVDCVRFGIDCSVLLCAGEAEQAIRDELQKPLTLPPAERTAEGGAV